jgi:membrane protein
VSASTDPHGHQAETPIEIPWRGWKAILIRTWQAIGTKNIGLISAGAAFYALLAIFPGLAALVSIYGLVANPAAIRHLTDITGSVIPKDANQLIVDQLQSLISKPRGGLSFAAVISILLALWSAHSGVTTVMIALNITYDEHEKRGYIRRNLLALGLTFGGLLFIIVALAAIALLPAIIDYLPIPEHAKSGLALIRWPILLVLTMLGLAVIYRLGPSRAHPRWQWISPGALISTILWIAGSALFSLYVAKFASYNKTYGSLGAVIVLLMWLYVSSYFMLIGATINAESERQTEKDTTTGDPQPIGKRDAVVADTVA